MQYHYTSLDPDSSLLQRFSTEKRDEQYQKLKEHRLISAFLDALPSLLAILNTKREIIYANEFILKELGIDNPQQLFGVRPGEALDCIHATEQPSGCGTTESCQYCGANIAILSSQSGTPAVQECRIIQKETGDALDFRVWASPVDVEGERFTIFMISDISDEKRRKALEQIFFHDILNTAGGLRGFSELLLRSNDDVDVLKEAIFQITEALIDEIQAQKDLMAAETNDLSVNPSYFNTMDLLEEVVGIYKKHLVAEKKLIEIDSTSESLEVKIDHTLIRRVVGNMLKNALEASKKKDTVKLGCRLNQDQVEFWVWNKTFIPREIQLQIFQRSFSTKGLGRGLGTHSIRLITQKYLNGNVGFTTQEKEGTTFYVRIPVSMQ